MNILLKIFVVHLVIDCSLAVEWSTSSGKYCTRKCTTKKEGNDEVYWCPVVDGTNDDTDKTETPGDYCTPYMEPQQVQTPPSGVHTTVKPVTLPAPLTTATTPGSGGAGFNPGTSNSMSSLKGFPCIGACAPTQNLNYECAIKGHTTKSMFSCSLSTAKLERKQVSSKNKMWCMSECSERIEDGDKIFKCKTMGGEDLCSPSHKKSYKDNTCTAKCSLYKGKGDHHMEYMCPVDKDKKKMEACGHWGKRDKMYGERETAKTVDFTNNDQVCAGPCDKGKCLFVEWMKKSSGQELQVSEGRCGTTSGAIMRMAPFSLIIFLGVFLKINV